MNKLFIFTLRAIFLLTFILPLNSRAAGNISTPQDTIKKPKIVEVQVYDLRGQGDSIAAEKAIYNSKKNVLILLVRSTNQEHINTVENCTHAIMYGGRTRIVIFLSDKPEDVDNDATLFFANGKFTRYVTQSPLKLTNNVTLMNAIEQEYDLYVH